MNLTQLPTLVKRSAKRVGRGIGSGKGGHTAGRGTKGQKSKGDIPLIFEGTKIKKSFIKRLPLLRGKGRFKSLKNETAVINVGELEAWTAKTPVTKENLVKAGIIEQGQDVKILGEGKLTQALEVKVPTSKSAAEKITKAGGKVEA